MDRETFDRLFGPETTSDAQIEAELEFKGIDPKTHPNDAIDVIAGLMGLPAQAASDVYHSFMAAR